MKKKMLLLCLLYYILLPFIYAGMCLGEGTGAVAAMPLLDMAVAVYRDMSSFSDIHIDAYEHLT